MRSKGAVTLGDLVGRVERLEVRCLRCERHGRLRLARLIAAHGADAALPDLRYRLAAGCAKAGEANPAERCNVYFPQSVELVRGGGAAGD